MKKKKLTVKKIQRSESEKFHWIFCISFVVVSNNKSAGEAYLEVLFRVVVLSGDTGEIIFDKQLIISVTASSGQGNELLKDFFIIIALKKY